MKTYWLCLLAFLSSWAWAAPDLMLVGTYQNQDVKGWVMSEKLDGVRGYWDGKKLFTRQQIALNPPAYFTAHFPDFAIDGELFSARNQFAQISSIVRSQEDKGWHQLKLFVFDVPDAKGDLFERLAVLKAYLREHPEAPIEIIEQIPVKNSAHIKEFLAQVESLGGEGIVLRNPEAPYERKRSGQILKLKSYLDEECTVIAYNPGKGQFANALGSVTCENHRGQFRIGSGFKLEDRVNPPPIGAQITYKYRGLTNKGLPRFATYWRTKPLEATP